jgi:hypothetical protein
VTATSSATPTLGAEIGDTATPTGPPSTFTVKLVYGQVEIAWNEPKLQNAGS